MSRPLLDVGESCHVDGVGQCTMMACGGMMYLDPDGPCMRCIDCFAVIGSIGQSPACVWANRLQPGKEK